MSYVLQGLLVGVVFIIVAFVALSWSQKPTKPAWKGADPSTRFFYCVLQREHGPQDFHIRLSRITANYGSLSTITLARQPEPHMDVVVHSGRSFASSVETRQRIWLMPFEYDQLVHKIADTGILQLMPEAQSNMEDGTWVGFEYHSDTGVRLAYGDNESGALRAIVRHLYEFCGDACLQAALLSDSLGARDNDDSRLDACVPCLRGSSTREYL